MSKDVIIAGTIAVGCIALIAVAFIAPKSKSSTEAETPKPETTTTFTDSALGVSGGMSTSGLSPGSPLNNGFDPVNPNGINALPPISPPAGVVNGGLPPVNPTGFGTTAGLNNSTSNFSTQLHGPTPVTPPAEPIAPVTSESKTHTVANGELLGDIALKYYKSSKQWRKIADANPGLDPKNLKVGQKLVIPGIEAKPTEAAPVVAGAGERTYTIKSGDTLYLVAKKELGSASRWKEIEKLNGVSSNELHVGQVIKLPASTSTSATPPVTDTSAPTVGSKTHTVSKGETLGDISKHYFGTSKNWKKIVDANPGTSPENLKVGQKLVIPEVAGSVTGPTGAVENSAPQMNEYVIKAGDTLGSIAQKELGSKNRWKELQEANPGLDPRNLRAGQKIKIPAKKSDAAPAVPEKASPPAVSPFGAPGVGAPGAKLPAAKSPSASATPAFGTPGTPAPGQSPSNFPADPTFASPYNGSNFGEPAQPFAQTGQGFNQTGTIPSTSPTAFPGQPSTFGAPGTPSAPGEAALR